MNYKYFTIFIYAPLGVVAGIMRVGKAILLQLLTIQRLDLSTMNRRFERLDPGAFDDFL